MNNNILINLKQFMDTLQNNKFNINEIITKYKSYQLQFNINDTVLGDDYEGTIYYIPDTIYHIDFKVIEDEYNCAVYISNNNTDYFGKGNNSYYIGVGEDYYEDNGILTVHIGEM